MQELYIDTPEGLADLCERLRGARAIALDTEFVRERTYYAQFCLLQLATEDLLVCVDPLAIEDLSPLIEVLYDTRVLKVMHAGRQDLELFFDRCAAVPQPVYDTQIAAALLGLGDQIGYASLVALFNGEVLDKSHSRTDWSRRPLTAEQIRYALDDVRHLLPIYHDQQRQLAALGRQDWLVEDFAGLVDVANYRRAPDEAWVRLRGARDLRGAQLAALGVLAAWREERARDADKPRKWILADDHLLEIARRLPKDLAGLQRIRGLPAATLESHGTRLLDLVEQGRAMPEAEWPNPARRQPLTPEQEALVDALQAELHLAEAESGVAAAVLASRSELGRLVLGARDINVLRGWRRHLVGERLLAFLQGDTRLHVSDGSLRQD